MHDADFALLDQTPTADGRIRYRVRIHAMGIERTWEFDPRSATYTLLETNGERLIKVGGYDMTSITGKRVREFLSSRQGSEQ
jgi:hypothetical protein